MFTHLHVHSEFSLLDGLPTVKNLAQAAKNLGMESLAITDHGVMYGAHKFYQACKKAEIKPIIGCELYISPRSMQKKVAKLDENPFHLTVLAKDETGYRNLIKLVSLGFTEGFYYRPRVDKELLEKYSKGLMGLSGCLSGEIPKLILNGKTKQATESAKQYIDIFGKENFYIELQRNKLKEQDAANKILIDISKTLQIPIVATCDSHYLKKDDALAQEVLMCISTGKQLDDPKRMKFATDEFFMRTEDEMNELFKDLPVALENTQAIAERCNVELEMKDWVLPEPPIPDEYKNDYDKYLYDETFSRGQKKLGRKLTPEEKKRVEYEWKVISDKGFSSYMIMVAQFSHWIRERKIPMTVRGSAAGSLLAYCLDIISANPLKFNLAFERFLNPLRPKAPDIDIDVASSRREELIEYSIETYGKENTAHIVTFGRMQARGSIRDAGRVLGLPLGYVDKIAKLIPPSGQGLAKVNIDLAIKKVPELSELLKQDTDATKLIQTAKKIEGVAKSQGVHACGILITPGPITDYCPVIWDKTLGKSGRMITQYEMDSIEDLGLIKMDFLGLTNLDTIAETIRIIKRERDIDIDPDDLPLDDEATYKLMRDLDTEGVFQFESEVMKNTLRILQPENIFDVSAALALVRPGPNQYQQEYADRKLGKKEVTYLDPRMKDYLSLTYGVLVYQEDIIRTVIYLGGMDWKEADRVRKATGKKKPDVLYDMKDELIERFIKHGMTKEKAKVLFDLFVPFTNYAFNQAHAAAYSLVTYTTAYLKTHYPVEFMAGLLKSEIDNFEKIGRIISECHKKGIKILPPDINKSKVDFSIEDKFNIRFGLAGIKNMGKGIVKAIIKERVESGQAYKNFDDFLNRSPLDKINQKAILYLIQVGALDNFGDRNALASALPQMYERYKKIQTSMQEGQIDIFSNGDTDDAEEKDIVATPLPPVDRASDADKIEWEKNLLGMYITVHPLGKIRAYLNTIGVKKISEVKRMNSGHRVQTCGLITNIKRISTKRENKSMAFLTIEDQSGLIEIIVFPTTYKKSSELLEKNVPTVIVGKVNVRDGERSIICNVLKRIDMDTATKTSEGVHLRIPTNANKDAIQKLKEVLKNNPGDTAVTVQIPDGLEVKSMLLKKGIELTDEVKERIAAFRVD